jgi:hypothetical protein
MYQDYTYRRPCIAVLVLLLLATPAAAENETTSPLRISYKDIYKEVEIIGKLGRPLGELLNVRGKWARAKDQSKPSGPVFQVTHLEGKRLASAVEFAVMTPVGRPSMGFAKPSDLNAEPSSVEWEVRGHEIGHGVFGFSESALEEARVAPAARAASFSIDFSYVSARVYEPPPAHKSAPSKPK